MRFTPRYHNLGSSSRCAGDEFTDESALAHARLPHNTDDGYLLAGEGVEQRGQVSVPPHERALVAAHQCAVGLDPFESSRRNWFGSTFDLHPLDRSEQSRVLDQARRRRRAHNPAGVCGRLHPLGHPDGMSDGGIAAGADANLAGDHLTGVHTDPNLQIYAVSPQYVGGQTTCDRLNLQGADARPQSVIFERHWSAEQRHQPIASEFVDRALVSLNNCRRPVEQLMHDLAQPLWIQCGRQLHRTHHVREKDGDLLTFRCRAAQTDR
jgi:hypothetical protein